MAALRTTLVKRNHAYTGEDIPWCMDGVDGAGPAGRLFHYLSGGGMRAFGRPAARERLERRQTRFLWFAAGLAALWAVFLFI